MNSIIHFDKTAMKNTANNTFVFEFRFEVLLSHMIECKQLNVFFVFSLKLMPISRKKTGDYFSNTFASQTAIEFVSVSFERGFVGASIHIRFLRFSS